MFRKILFVVFLFFSFVGFTQFNQQLDSLKQSDNYSEFIYSSLDEFSKKPTIQNLTLLKFVEENLWRNPSAHEEHLASIYFNVNYGYYLKEFGDLSQSILKYEKAKNTFQNNSFLKYDIIEFCLKPLANNYTRLGDFNRAEDILKTTIQIAQESNNKNHLISGYKNLAIVKRTTGNFETAINYLVEAEKLSSSKQIISGLYSDMAISYLFLENLNEVEQFVGLSEKNNIEREPQILFINSKTLGMVFIKKKEFNKALLYFNKALDFGFNSFGRNNREIAKIYNSIAKCYVELKDYETAEANYKKALKTLIVLKENFSNNIYAENTLKESFDGLAQLFSITNKFEKSLEFYKYSFRVEKEIQQTISSQESKVLMQQEVKKRSEACIDICYELFQKSNNLKWIEKAYSFSKNSKYAVLNQANFSANSKSKFSSDTLIQQEQRLKFEKSKLTKNIALEELKLKSANIDLLAELVEERDEISNKLQLLKTKLLNKFPSIYKTRKEIPIKHIQDKLLLKNQSLIDFFDGENSVYRFEISKSKGISVQKVVKDQKFKRNLLSFIKLFASDRGIAIQNNIQNYTNLGYYLYKKLFKNIEGDQLVIIPDGLLSFVPFDALITEKTSMLNFEKLPYLMKNYQIQLAYSVTSLIKNKEKKSNKFIGYFPIFENNHRDLSALNYTVLEAENIEKELKGLFLMNSKASKISFEKNVSNASIIHLSTHASAGSFYQPAVVEFYNETLFLPEIYGYNLSADLLVLSACETGLGVVRKGEGAMSLARGFSYAGVKNLIVSLWKVNDKATAQLISGFYKNYSDIGNKSKSLYQSKIDYLENQNISALKKSPYYWASFVFIGEIDKGSNLQGNFLWLLIIPFLLVASYFLYKKR